jgi:hypothetical protein
MVSDAKLHDLDRTRHRRERDLRPTRSREMPLSLER